MYCDIIGMFVLNFDILVDVLINGCFMWIVVIGDLDDFNFMGEIIYDISYIDVIKIVDFLKIDFVNLRFVFQFKDIK